MKKIVSAALFLFFLHEAFPQKQITVDDFTTKQTFAQKTIAGINWMNDGEYYTTLSENKIIKYNITTGQAVETVLDGTALNPQLKIRDYAYSNDEGKLMLKTEVESIYRRSFTAEYYVYDIINKSMKKLSNGGKQSYAAFSPDGTRAAFVRGNNLFYVNLSDMSEVQVTDDGKINHIINGTTDWVYEEEFGFVIGFFWSPDGKKLAYYRFDETNVKEYNMQLWGKSLYPVDYKFKYPKAGEANAKVEIWIYNLDNRNHVKADTGTETDVYIPQVQWTSNPNILSIIRLSRLQHQIDIIHANAATGTSATILTEKSDKYIDIEMVDDLTYLSDGKQFIHASESDGFKHFYLYTTEGKLVRQITSGNFEVLDLVGVNERAKVLYYISAEVSPLERHFYSISFDGKKKTRLSKAPGTHKINISHDFQVYIDQHSSAKQPVVASLYRTKGNTLIKVLEKNEALVRAAADYALPEKQFFSYKTVDGTNINGFMLLPNNFDSLKQYPAMLYQYSGPGSQNAQNAWGGNHIHFHHLLAQKGYVVVVVDTRGTGGRGEQYRKLTYKQLGKYELEDLIAAGKYLSGLKYVDRNRLGIWGWSYGGYMTSLVMTRGEGLFRLGIAVSPVTNWRFYDTVYTERYLQTPQLNAAGYDENSPLTYAAGLQGNFFLIHGTGDDNVHFQNSVVFGNALIQAGKHFDSFYYPDKAHSIAGAKNRHHLYTMMLNYIVKNL